MIEYFRQLLFDKAQKSVKQLSDKQRGFISDGYHTYNELYDHRIKLFIALCKEIKGNPMNQNEDFTSVWRSKKHSDGSEWSGWFIMGIGTKNGRQITYHLPVSEWANTNFADSLEKAPEFDGHTPEDVLKRLSQI